MFCLCRFSHQICSTELSMSTLLPTFKVAKRENYIKFRKYYQHYQTPKSFNLTVAMFAQEHYLLPTAQTNYYKKAESAFLSISVWFRL